MIIDVHTHLPTHGAAVPEDEQVVDRVMRPDRAVTLTNSGDDYLRDMGPVDRAFVFGIAGVPGAPPDLRRHAAVEGGQRCRRGGGGALS